ncbi:MAG: hypothetical protein LJE61_11475 [Thiocapsa sp.]|nr:hypothetical protein [Thiocapsa sp.]MCG6985802.1 hypothetical protein [Thiocapsa sp.]
MSLSLTIDYGNGAQKTFGKVDVGPLAEPVGGRPDELDVFDVLDAAARMEPGLEYEFKVTLASDRAGNEGGHILSVDGVSGENASWQVCVNRKPGVVQLRRPTPGSFQPRGEPRIEDGDAIALRLIGGS